MKFFSLLTIVFAATILVFTFPSCKKNKCGDTNVSLSGGSKSHNFGQNCLNCHKSGGEGEGCFTVAGSASNSALTSNLTGGIIKLYTGANGSGTLKYSIPIDSKGNFYTTESIDYSGLYPAITGPSGATNYMSGSLNTGACNSCHGASTGKLFGN